MKKLSAFVLSAAIAASGMLSAAEVDKREEHQKERIEQGVKSGELTHKEAKELRQDERAIKKEVREERAENGGKLTKGERKEINQEQNKESRKIYRKKHNDRRRKHAE